MLSFEIFWILLESLGSLWATFGIIWLMRTQALSIQFPRMNVVPLLSKSYLNGVTLNWEKLIFEMLPVSWSDIMSTENLDHSKEVLEISVGQRAG